MGFRTQDSHRGDSNPEPAVYKTASILNLDGPDNHHQIGSSVEAHILIAFLGYCLLVTLRMKLRVAAPGPTPRAVLAALAAIQMVDVVIPTECMRLPT